MCFPKGCVPPANQNHLAVQKCVWLQLHRIHLSSQMVHGSHHTESWCCPEGGVAATMQNHCVFPMGGGGSHARLQEPGRSNPRTLARRARLQKPGRSNPRISCVFPKGCVAPTQKNHCVSPKVEWLLPHRFIVFSQRLCGSRHTDPLCCTHRACGSHCTILLCFPKGCVAPTTQNLSLCCAKGRVAPTKLSHI